MDITGIAMEVSTDGLPPVSVIAQSFFQWGRPENSLFFSRFTLAPGMVWNYVISFFKPLPKNEQTQINNISKAIKDNIERKLKERKRTDASDNSLMEADSSLVGPAFQFFRDHSIWRVGEYSVKLSINCIPQKSSAVYSFRFILYESDIQQISENAAESYQYGFNLPVGYPQKNTNQPVVDLLDLQRLK